MKIKYFSDTDSLYIDLSSQKSVESKEISEGVVADYDAKGNITGIDIDEAGKRLDMREIILNRIPCTVKEVSEGKIFRI